MLSGRKSQKTLGDWVSLGVGIALDVACVGLLAKALRFAGRAAGTAPALFRLLSSATAGPRATAELLNAIRNHGRTIVVATEGSEALRFLEKAGAEASVSGPKYLDIILRENPSKAAALEEFLHGVQSRLGIIERLGQKGAEAHVADFMQRHRKLLGLP